MAYVVRTKDNPGDVGRAADQQQSVDNESALYAAVLGAGPVAAGGMVMQFVKKTGIADNVATTVFSITTTNEAGNNDAGVYACEMTGLAAHGTGPTGETSGQYFVSYFARGLNDTGAAGNSGASAVGVSAVGASTAATKTIALGLATTIVETSEYAVDVRFQFDLQGASVTTGNVICMVRLYYLGFTTPPVITSAG